LTDQALCVAEEEAVAQVAEAAAYGEVQKLQVGVGGWGGGHIHRGTHRHTYTDVGLRTGLG
jgi:hypothetical protein